MKPKTAIIWGASGGIGSALLKKLVADDWQVAAVARKPEAISGLTPWVFEADFANPGAVQAVSAEVGQVADGFDWWVYAAGDITSAPVKELSPETWERILDANLTGAYLCAHFSQELLKPGAPMYFLGAVSERMRLPGLAAYAAAKAGLEALGDVLFKEMRRTVVVVRPGAVKTPLWEKVPFKMPPNASAPEVLAEEILKAYMNGHSERFLNL